MRNPSSLWFVVLALFVLHPSWARGKEAPEYLEADLAYLTPIGMSLGLAWGPVQQIELYGQAGVIAFDSGTGYDDTNPSSLQLGGFFTYEFAIHARHCWAPTQDEPWTRKVFIGLAARDFMGVGQGDALDCLHCSDWQRSADYPFNIYAEGGCRIGMFLGSVSVRLTDGRGTGEWWGWDPYGVGDTWEESWENMNTPAFIIQLSLAHGF